MQSSTLMTEDAGMPFHELQAEQIRLFREAWAAAGHEREPRVSVSRSIFALVDDQQPGVLRTWQRGSDKVGSIDAQTKAIFGRSHAAEPDVLVKELAKDTPIQAADTLLLTVPNQLGVSTTPTRSRASSSTWPRTSAGASRWLAPACAGRQRATAVSYAVGIRAGPDRASGGLHQSPAGASAARFGRERSG